MADHDPYSAPRSPVLSTDHDPYRFQPGHRYELTVGELRLAGWLALLSAALTIPYYSLWFEVSADGSHALEELATLAGLLLTAVALYMLSRFRRLLNERSHFNAADGPIQLIIFLAVGMAVLSVMITLLPDSGVLQVVSFIASVVYGVALIRLGRVLRNCRDSLYGKLPLMAVLTIASGGLIASVVLAFLSAFTSLVLDILFAVVFFNAARELAAIRSEDIA
jgi:hypothetical protein